MAALCGRVRRQAGEASGPRRLRPFFLCSSLLQDGTGGENEECRQGTEPADRQHHFGSRVAAS